MIGKERQIQEEQISLLPQFHSSQQKSFDNVPFQMKQHPSPRAQMKSSSNDSSYKSLKNIIVEPSNQDMSNNPCQSYVTIHFNASSSHKQKVQPTEIKLQQAPKQNGQSDFLRKRRLIREQAELQMQKWMKQRRIESDNRIKKIKEQVRLQRQQQQEERRRIIAMNTWSDQISFFENIKRLLGIAQRNDKKNK